MPATAHDIAADTSPDVIEGRGDPMLVLSRKTDEGFLIGADIYVKVLHVEHGRVKLGITAPAETTVMREELVNREQNSNSPAPAFEREPAAHVVSTGQPSSD